MPLLFLGRMQCRHAILFGYRMGPHGDPLGKPTACSERVLDDLVGLFDTHLCRVWCLGDIPAVCRGSIFLWILDHSLSGKFPFQCVTWKLSSVWVASMALVLYSWDAGSYRALVALGAVGLWTIAGAEG